jgi:hypothetical protein
LEKLVQVKHEFDIDKMLITKALNMHLIMAYFCSYTLKILNGGKKASFAG